MGVKTAFGDVVEDGLVLVADEAFQPVFAVGVVQKGRVGGFAGIDELAAPVNQRFDEMGARAALLGLDQEGNPGVKNGR